MTKTEFREALGAKLSGLPENEVKDHLDFYCEMIEDKIEDGASEEDAVASIGAIDKICAQVMADVPLKSIVKDKIKNKRSYSTLEILFLVLGFPLWFPLAVAAVSVVFSLYVSIWAVVISLWSVDLAFAVASVGAIVAIPFFFINGTPILAALMFCAALACAGLAILFFVGCKYMTKAMVVVSEKLIVSFKYMLVGKENKNA